MEGTFEWERSDNRKVDEMIFGESDMRRLRLYMLMTLLLLLTSCDGPVGFAIHNAKVDDHNYRIDYGVDTVMDFELKNNQMLLCGSINGELDTLLFDSGSSYYLVRFSMRKTSPMA